MEQGEGNMRYHATKALSQFLHHRKVLTHRQGDRQMDRLTDRETDETRWTDRHGETHR